MMYEVHTQRRIWHGRRPFLGHPCAYCGKPAECLDHTIPLSRGGTDDRSNMVPACRYCNSSKGSLTADEFRLILPVCKKMRPVRDRLQKLRREREQILREYWDARAA